MASRRSARLAAIVSNTNLVDPPPPPSPAPASRPATSRKRKLAEASTAEALTVKDTDTAPSTPRKRRTAKDGHDAAPPATPTPAAASLMAEPARTPRPKPKPAAVARLADPSRTNALLRSPKTSRIIASAPVEAVPSKLRGSRNTATILEEACAHLIKVDPRMKPLIDAHHCRVFSPEGLAEQVDPFEALCSSIISQQVSGAAAKSIKARFVALFNPGTTAATSTSSSASASATTTTTVTTVTTTTFPSPAAVAATPLETLRTAGLSQRKAEYLQGLAAQFASGALTAQMLADAPYDEVLERLTAVRGLGRWSVEMFACFALKRMDVFSLGDLGVQRGMAAFVGRDVARLKAKGGGKWKYMAEREMEEISERFRPFRSVFMWYMWRVEETDVSTME